jgi:hypothetical protein
MAFVIIILSQLSNEHSADSLHQYLPRISNVVMDLALNFGANHDVGATTVRAGHTGCCAKQPAD